MVATLLTLFLAWMPLSPTDIVPTTTHSLAVSATDTVTVTSYGGPYVTEPDSIHLPTIAITQTAPVADDGYLFFATFRGLNDLVTPNYLIILDGNGDYLYFGRTPENRIAMDFKVTDVAGTPLLSHFLTANFATAWAEGDYRILDESYTEIDLWRTSQPYTAENHELLLLDNGNALLMAYDSVPMDLRAHGGREDAQVIDVVIQELNAMRDIVFEWHSLDHIPITATYVSLNAPVVDYAHANSIEIDSDDNLIVSFRNTSQIVKIERTTGQLLWRLGGRANEFTFVNDDPGSNGPSSNGPGDDDADEDDEPQYFAFQHDARRLANGNLTLFDNGNGLHDSYSRAVEYELNEVTKTVTRTWQALDEHTIALGNAQRLSSGNTLVNWGFAGKLTEVSPAEERLREIELVGDGTYRAFRLPWEGMPETLPKLVARTITTTTTLYMSWNGATAVDRYAIYGGADATELTLVGEVPKQGFETMYSLGSDGADENCFWQVAALDGEGTPLQRSVVALRDTPLCLRTYGERLYLPLVVRR